MPIIVRGGHTIRIPSLRITLADMMPPPPDHTLFYCVCDCGAHRTYFYVHRNDLLSHIARYHVMRRHIRRLRREEQINPVAERLEQIELEERVHEVVTDDEEDEEDEFTDETESASEEEDIDR